MADEDRDELLEGAAEEFRMDDESEEGKGGKKKLLLILLPLLLLGGGGAGVYFSGILEDKADEVVQTETVAEPEPVKSVYFDLPDMLVNLNSVGPKPSFLKLRASLELEEGADTGQLRKLQPRIIDKFNVYMRELRLNDLRASGGLAQLREELRLEINRAVSPVQVKQVLFRNMLVQ